jgi:hypothetical protein
MAASSIDLPGLIPLYMSGRVPQAHALARHLGWTEERIAKGVPSELHKQICNNLGPAMPDNPVYGEYQPPPFKNFGGVGLRRVPEGKRNRKHADLNYYVIRGYLPVGSQ